MTDFTDYLATRSAAELADLLAHATGFVFEPDLPDVPEGLRHNWAVRLDGLSDAWVFRWAYSSRCWSKRLGGWLRDDAAELLWLPNSPWRAEVTFGFAEAMAALPRILQAQAEQAMTAEAQRRAMRPVPSFSVRGVGDAPG